MSQPYYARGVSPKAWARGVRSVGFEEFQRILIDEFGKDVKERAERMVGHLRTDMSYIAASHILPAHAQGMERQFREKLVSAAVSAIAPDSLEPEAEREVGR